MPRWTGIAVLLLIAGIAAGVLIAPGRAPRDPRKLIANNGDEDEYSLTSSTHRQLGMEQGQGKSHFVVASDDLLDPLPGKTFVVGIELRLSGAPQRGKSERIIFKYAGEAAPYPGWAFAVRSFETSVRPEVYWQSGKSREGWFTFEEITIVPESPLRFWLVANEAFISLYLDELSVTPAAPEASARLRFLGGYTSRQAAMPATKGELLIRSGFSPETGVRIDIQQVLIGHLPASAMTPELFIAQLKAGTGDLAGAIPESGISLNLREDGQDYSRFARTIKLIAESL
ncbi:MAG TPA: hypothetical protein PLP17_12810 [Oligoflexia bacterium]|nr:hypothetical protein [Oligoflexia bacterium]